MLSEYLLNRRAIMLGEKLPPEPKPKKAISIKSVKRVVEDKLLSKIRKEMFKENPLCQLKSPICTGKAECLDHKQKTSPKNRINRNNLLRSCFACNLYKESHVEWANKKGVAVSRFKKHVSDS